MYNRGTITDYNYWHNAAMDAAGWTEDEKLNGKLQSCNYNPATKSWDIPTGYKTIEIFNYIQNPDLSDDVVFQQQTDTLTVLTQQENQALMDLWFPDSD